MTLRRHASLLLAVVLVAAVCGPAQGQVIFNGISGESHLSILGFSDTDVVIDEEVALWPLSLPIDRTIEGSSGSGSAKASIHVTPVFDLDGYLREITIGGEVSASGASDAGHPDPQDVQAEFQLDVPLITLGPTEITANGSLDFADGASFGEMEVLVDSSFPNQEVFSFLADGSMSSLTISNEMETTESASMFLSVLGYASSNVGRPDESGELDITLTFDAQIEPPPDVDELRWDSPSGGSFGTAANWDPEQVPEGDDTAIFDAVGTYTVSLSEDRTHHTAEVRTGSVTFATGSNRYLLRKLQVGGSGPASVTVPPNPAHDSGVDADEIIVAGQSQLFTNGMVYVGDVDLPPTGMNGVDVVTNVQAGHLVRVEGGSILSSATGWVNGPGADGSRALVEVLGEGSSWMISTRLTVGHHPQGGSGMPGEIYSSGRVRVAGGGRLEATFGMIIDSGEEGTESLVEVLGTADGGNGQPSELLATTLTVGNHGRAMLTASDGALVKADVVNIGVHSATNGDPPSHGTVVFEGPDTRLAEFLAVAPAINVGGRGDAVLILRDGASITGLLTVGLANGSEDAEAIVRIEGRGSTTPAEQQTSAFLPAIAIGTGDGSTPGRGELHITAGAQVQAFDVDLATGSPTGGRAELSVDGHQTRLDVGNRILVGGGSPGHLSVTDSAIVHMPVGVLTVEENGTLELRSGAEFTAGGVNIHPGGTVIGDEGTLHVDESLVVNNGTLQIGSSPGRFTIDGEYEQGPDGVLEMEIAGPTPGMEHDQLVITGDAVLDGTLELWFLDGYAPVPGDAFELIAIGGTISGAFDTVNVFNLDPSFQYALSTAGGGLELTALSDGALIPEPGTFTLAILALGGIAGCGWRRSKKRIGHR